MAPSPTLRVVHADRPTPAGPRRPGWRELRALYPGILAGIVVAILVLVAADAWMLVRRARYEHETARLRAGMSEAERERADRAMAHEANEFRMMLALGRRQAHLDESLHLSVVVDSGVMYFEREGAILRALPIRMGPEKTVGTAPDTVRMPVPRGERTVESVLTADSGWVVPAWVYHDRGLAVPDDRTVKGALGPAAVILSGGTVIYSMPTAGPLNDSSYVLPGGVRATVGDLAAIAPNLRPGMTVYFY